jgi:hypothetical protein
VILRLAGEDGRDQAKGASGPGGELVLIELITGDGLDQAVHPQSALCRGRDEAGAGQGTRRLGPLQAITQRGGQYPARLGRACGKDIQVDLVGIKERAQPHPATRYRPELRIRCAYSSATCDLPMPPSPRTATTATGPLSRWRPTSASMSSRPVNTGFRGGRVSPPRPPSWASGRRRTDTREL